MTHPQPPVAVEQCDRDRAWPFRPFYMTDTVATVRSWNAGKYDNVPAIQAFALARHQERERCARVAEDDVPQSHDGSQAAHEAIAADRIAAAIRSGKEPA